MIFTMSLNYFDYIDELEVSEVMPFEKYLHENLVNYHSELLDKLKVDFRLTDEIIEEMKEVIEENLKSFMAVHRGA